MIQFEHSLQITRDFPRNYTACYGPVNLTPDHQMESNTFQLLQECQNLKKQFAQTEPEPIRHWREVFAKMGAPPKYLSSIVSLWNRFTSKNQLWEIRPLVDLYNAVSLRCLTPMAAYDAEKIEGNISLKYAQKGEHFKPLGKPNQTEKTKNGEIVYADQQKIICRYWNLRDCDQTKITDKTKSVILFADIVADDPNQAKKNSKNIQSALNHALKTAVTCILSQ